MTTPRPICLSSAKSVTLPAGTRIFEAGDPCEQFFYLLDGSVRVDLITQSGKALMLYRIEAGETCILTTSCLLSRDPYCAEALVEEDVVACVIPQSQFQSLLSSSDEFRELVFASFARRLTALMAKVEEVAFVSLDQRLSKRLLELANDDMSVSVTHEQLAADLGTAREVISRKLHQWEQSGLVLRGRASLTIRDAPQLTHLAALGD